MIMMKYQFFIFEPGFDIKSLKNVDVTTPPLLVCAYTFSETVNYTAITTGYNPNKIRITEYI